MSLFHSPRIVTDGLVLHLDAANVKSYPGYGNSAYDLSGTTSTGITFYNTASITEKAFDFTPFDNDGITIADENYLLTDFTMECLVKINGTHLHYDGALISSGNWNSSHWAFSVLQNNNGIRTRRPHITYGYTFTVGNWYHLVFRRSSSTLNFFVNNEKSGNYTDATAIPLESNATNTAIGRETYAGGYFNLNGKIAVARIYDRALSDSEVATNFAALRGRYGL